MSLEYFGISLDHGFLPDEPPLPCLPNPYYKPWEVILQNLSSLIKSKRLRNEIGHLPVLSTSRLVSEREWRRAYVLLSFLAHGYIWGGERPAERLPPSITCPFLKVSAHLGLPPVATYAALCLWNFSLASPNADRCELSNLKSLNTITGTPDEAWFYGISIAMEARGGVIIPVALEAMKAVSLNNSKAVCSCLIKVSECLDDLASLLERMHERCNPDIFYHEIRPMLAGSKNMAVAGLPRGVFYDEGDGKGQWRQYSGGSNAQSSLIQFFDIVLGVQHSATGEETGKKCAFMQEMRNYMPKGHRRFLGQLSDTTIRDFVMRHSPSHPIVEDYNEAVAMLTALRDKHIQIVTRYIILPATKRSSRLCLDRNTNSATDSTKTATTCSVGLSLQGTGGTRLMPFLKQTRNETKDVALSDA